MFTRISSIVLLFFLWREHISAKPHQLVQQARKELESTPKRNKGKRDNDKQAQQSKKIKGKKRQEAQQDLKKGIEGELTNGKQTVTEQKKGEDVVKEKRTISEKEEEKITRLQQAKIYIDQAIQDPDAIKKGNIWYYHGVVYDKLMRENITTDAAPQFLQEALKSYGQVKKLTKKASQYHSFAQINLDSLWFYYLDRGRRYYRKEEFERAIIQFEYCKLIRPKDPFSTFYMGMATQQDKQFEVALQHYEDYLILGGTDPAVYVNMATIIHTYLKDSEKGLTILAQAIQKFPLNNTLLTKHFRICTELGKRQEEEKRLEEQVHEVPTSPSYYYQLAYWYENRGNIAYAIPTYQKAIALAPHELGPIRQLGMLYYNEAVSTHQATKMLIKTWKEKAPIHPGISYPLFELTFPQRRWSLPTWKYLLHINGTNYLTTQNMLTYLATMSDKEIFLTQEYPVYINKQWKVINTTYLLQPLYRSDQLICPIRNVHAQKVIQLISNQIYFKHQKKLKRHLEEALVWLKKGRRIDKDDVSIAKCLYSTYYRLRKYASAKALVVAMRKKGHYLNQKEDLLSKKED